MQIFEFLILTAQMHGLYAYLSYYLANKRSLHVHSQDLEIPTLIGEKKEKLKLPTTTITKKISLKYPCA